MQDTRTGDMVPLDLQEDILGNTRKRNFKDTLSELQKAGEAAGIPTEHQGLVLRVGDIVTVKEHRYHRASKFEVRGFEGGLLHLEGVKE